MDADTEHAFGLQAVKILTHIHHKKIFGRRAWGQPCRDSGVQFSAAMQQQIPNLTSMVKVRRWWGAAQTLHRFSLILLILYKDWRELKLKYCIILPSTIFAPWSPNVNAVVSTIRYDFDSTAVRQPFDYLSKVIKVTVNGWSNALTAITERWPI